ncbi:MAG: substrate-binding domain-containing protein [Baekduiaceae bacterium]
MSTFLALGCNGKEDVTVAPSPEVGAVIKGVDNPFFVALRDGMQDAAVRNDVPLDLREAADLQDTSGQALAVEGLEGSDCYLVNPINRTNLIEPLAKVASGKPVIAVDSPVDRRAAKAAGIDLRTYVGTDNEAAGWLAAQALDERLPGGAAVAVVTGIPGDAGSEARARGFLRGARGRLRVVARVSADFDEQQARRAIAEVLAAEPDLRGVFAVNDEMALGAARAARGEDRVDVLGVDGTSRALRAIRRGELTGTVAQFPYLMGQLGVEACVASVEGRELPANIDAPIELVTRANVDEALRNRPRPGGGFVSPLER